MRDAFTIWRHVATDSLYLFLGDATCSTNGERDGKEKSVFYFSLTYQRWFYRESKEFFDGRFERVEPPVWPGKPSQANIAGEGAGDHRSEDWRAGYRAAKANSARYAAWAAEEYLAESKKGGETQGLIYEASALACQSLAQGMSTPAPTPGGERVAIDAMLVVDPRASHRRPDSPAPPPADTAGEREPVDPHALLRTGGRWMGAARTWLQWHKLNGSRVTWGSNDELQPAFTVREVEELAAHVAAAALNEREGRRPDSVPLPALLAALGLPAGTSFTVNTALDRVEGFTKEREELLKERRQNVVERRTLATVHEIVIRHSHSPDDSTDSLVAIEEELAERFPSSWPSWPGEPEGT